MMFSQPTGRERWERDRPLPWERTPMTVCIALSCQEGNDYRLVLCHDWLSSSALGSSDMHYKRFPIGDKWAVMHAGDIFARKAPPLLDANNTSPGLSTDNVAGNDQPFLNTFPYLAAPH